VPVAFTSVAIGSNSISRRVPTDYPEKIFDVIEDNIMKVYSVNRHNTFLVYERRGDKLPQKVFSSLLGNPLKRELISSILNGR